MKPIRFRYPEPKWRACASPAVFLQEALKDQAGAYLERGRVHENCGDDELMDVWVSAFELWFETRSGHTGRDMDDVAAEIRLRRLNIPYDRVKLKIDQLRKKIAPAGHLLLLRNVSPATDA
jgi:hypothetical protein